MAKIDAAPSQLATAPAPPQALAAVTPWGSGAAVPIAAPAAAQLHGQAVDSLPGAVDAPHNYVDHAQSQTAKEIDKLTKELDEARSSLECLLVDKAQVIRAVQEASVHVDVLRGILEKLQPAQTVTEVVKDYHMRQREILEQRSVRIQALRGVDLKALLAIRSPIDAAMARKSARGLKRPTTI